MPAQPIVVALPRDSEPQSACVEIAAGEWTEHVVLTANSRRTPMPRVRQELTRSTEYPSRCVGIVWCITDTDLLGLIDSEVCSQAQAVGS